MPDKRPEAIPAYLVAIRRALVRGDSTEHTHRPALIDLVHALVKGVHCVNEPKGQKYGHPDIKVTLGETPIGYIRGIRDSHLFDDDVKARHGKMVEWNGQR